MSNSSVFFPNRYILWNQCFSAFPWEILAIAQYKLPEKYRSISVRFPLFQRDSPNPAICISTALLAAEEYSSHPWLHKDQEAGSTRRRHTVHSCLRQGMTPTLPVLLGNMVSLKEIKNGREIWYQMAVVWQEPPALLCRGVSSTFLHVPKEQFYFIFFSCRCFTDAVIDLYFFLNLPQNHVAT